MNEQGTFDFGVGYRTTVHPKALARRSDPSTSRKAAEEIQGQINNLQLEALNLVRRNPGLTVNELAEIANLRDPRTINRRLPELLKHGLVRRELDGDRCSVTGRTAGRWWAV